VASYKKGRPVCQSRTAKTCAKPQGASVRNTKTLISARDLPPASEDDSDKAKFTLQFPDELAFVFGDGLVEKAHAIPDLRTASNDAPELDDGCFQPLLILGAWIAESGFSMMIGVLMTQDPGSVGMSEATYRRVGMGEIWMRDENVSWSGKMKDGVAVHAVHRLVERGFCSTVTIV
jgi:hypothetical protein